MSDLATHRIGHRELAHRTSDGFDVKLLWNPADDSIAVRVLSLESAEIHEFDVRRDQALNAFHHPFVYAALQDLAASVTPKMAA
jgi:hypothetical protein